VVSAFLLAFLTGVEEEAVLDERIRYKSRELEEVQSIQSSQINGYTWTDRDNNRVSVPLEQGKNEVLRLYGNQGD